MWYLKNISNQKIIDTDNGNVIMPQEIKAYSNEYSFLRMCAAYNGLVAVVSEEEYRSYLGSFGELSQKKEDTEQVIEEKPKRGRSKKQ